MPKRGPGEGSIYLGQDGRWVGRLSLGYDSQGKRRRKIVYGRSQREVREKLERLKVRSADGIQIVTARETMGDFLEGWLRDGEASGRWAPKTHRDHAAMVRAHLIPALGRRRLEEVTPAHVQDLVNQKVAAGLSPRTVKLIRGLLSQALDQAVRWGRVPRNVASLVEAPRQRRPEFQVLNAAQARILLDGVRGSRVEALYTVAVSVGLRRGEALGLCWDAVDLDAGKLAVRTTLHLVDGEYSLQPPKTEKSRRTIALPLIARDALRRHRTRQLEERLAAGAVWEGADWDLVFTTPTGRPLHGPTVTRRFQRLLPEIGLPRLRFHDLRHSCASLLLAQEVDLKSIQETLGHSSITVAMDVYSHLSDRGRDAVAQRMGAALSGAS